MSITRNDFLARTQPKRIHPDKIVSVRLMPRFVYPPLPMSQLGRDLQCLREARVFS